MLDGHGADLVPFVQIDDGVLIEIAGFRYLGGSHAGRRHLGRIAAELGHPEPDRVIVFGAGLMEDLRTRGVLLGTSRRAIPRHPGDDDRVAIARSEFLLTRRILRLVDRRREQDADFRGATASAGLIEAPRCGDTANGVG